MFMWPLGLLVMPLPPFLGCIMLRMSNTSCGSLLIAEGPGLPDKKANKSLNLEIRMISTFKEDSMRPRLRTEIGLFVFATLLCGPPKVVA